MSKPSSDVDVLLATLARAYGETVTSDTALSIAGAWGLWQPDEPDERAEAANTLVRHELDHLVWDPDEAVLLVRRWLHDPAAWTTDVAQPAWRLLQLSFPELDEVPWDAPPSTLRQAMADLLLPPDDPTSWAHQALTQLPDDAHSTTERARAALRRAVSPRERAQAAAVLAEAAWAADDPEEALHWATLANQLRHTPWSNLLQTDAPTLPPLTVGTLTGLTSTGWRILPPASRPFARRPHMAPWWTPFAQRDTPFGPELHLLDPSLDPLGTSARVLRYREVSGQPLVRIQATSLRRYLQAIELRYDVPQLTQRLDAHHIPTYAPRLTDPTDREAWLTALADHGDRSTAVVRAMGLRMDAYDQPHDFVALGRETLALSPDCVTAHGAMVNGLRALKQRAEANHWQRRMLLLPRWAWSELEPAHILHLLDRLDDQDRRGNILVNDPTAEQVRDAVALATHVVGSRAALTQELAPSERWRHALNLGFSVGFAEAIPHLQASATQAGYAHLLPYLDAG